MESPTYDSESDIRKFKEIIIKQEQELIQLRSDLNYHIGKQDIAISELGKDVNNIKNNLNIECKRITKLQDKLQSSSGNAKDGSFEVAPQNNPKEKVKSNSYDGHTFSNGINKKGERE